MYFKHHLRTSLHLIRESDRWGRDFPCSLLRVYSVVGSIPRNSQQRKQYQQGFKALYTRISPNKIESVVLSSLYEFQLKKNKLFVCLNYAFFSRGEIGIKTLKNAFELCWACSG